MKTDADRDYSIGYVRESIRKVVGDNRINSKNVRRWHEFINSIRSDLLVIEAATKAYETKTSIKQEMSSAYIKRIKKELAKDMNVESEQD